MLAIARAVRPVPPRPVARAAHKGRLAAGATMLPTPAAGAAMLPTPLLGPASALPGTAPAPAAAAAGAGVGVTSAAVPPRVGVVSVAPGVSGRGVVRRAGAAGV